MADTSDQIADPIADPIAQTPPDSAAPSPPPAPPPAPRRASPVLPVLGGVVAAVIGFGLAQVIQINAPSPDIAVLQSTLAAQAAQIAALEAAQGQSQPDPELSARVTALEGVPDLTPRIAALEGKLATASASSGNPDLMAQLQAEVDALKSGSLPAVATAAIDAKLAEASASIDSIKSEAEAIAAGAAKRAALRQILAALDSGAPYTAAITDLAGPDLPPVLADNAASGLPTLQSLRIGFPDAARLALNAALQADMGESWAERAGAFLRGQTGARSLTPRDGDDPDAVLSRSEAALTAGDLPVALAELDGLAPPAQAAMADWRAQADLHLQAAVAVQGLLAATGQ